MPIILTFEESSPRLNGRSIAGVTQLPFFGESSALPKPFAS